MNSPKSPEELRSEILRLTREYSRVVHANNALGKSDAAGAAGGAAAGSAGELKNIPYAARVFDECEVAAAVGSALDFWLTLGAEGAAFERELAAFLGVSRSLLVNSGSSANLLALAALTSHKIPRERRLLRGDEVITCAAGFPTTVAPIVQCGAVPVFIDNDPLTGNARPEQLAAAYRAGKTKAVILAHTLGNPFDVAAVLGFCRERNLWLIEDNCDALGSAVSLPAELARRLGHTENSPGFAQQDGVITRRTGAWGDLSTQSFYPPHHITLGEGGAVNIVAGGADGALLRKVVESMRDWGRDCWCPSGKDDTCGRRFGWRGLGELPFGYDHKYAYSHLGYNLKPLDTQAAIGREQLRKLPAFIAARQANWEFLRAGLADLGEFFEFTGTGEENASALPPGSSIPRSPFPIPCISWFGFMLLVRAGAPFTRPQFAEFLVSRKIGNRVLFGGNLMRQPAFVELLREYPDAARVAGGVTLTGADRLMSDAIFLGVYPGLSRAQLTRVVADIHEFCAARAGGDRSQN